MGNLLDAEHPHHPHHPHPHIFYSFIIYIVCKVLIICDLLVALQSRVCSVMLFINSDDCRTQNSP